MTSKRTMDIGKADGGGLGKTADNPPNGHVLDGHAQDGHTPGGRERRVSRGTATPDRWFDDQLTQLYADVANEPIPSYMLELIRKLKSSAD
jgi:hypothetical protein